MTNMRNRLILIFLALMVVILVVSLVLPLTWYNFIISDLVGSIGKDKELTRNINAIKEFLFEEQRIIADSVMNPAKSMKEDFKRVNQAIGEKIQGFLDGGTRSRIKDDDAKELERLATLNGKLYESYEKQLLPGIEQADTQKLTARFKNMADSYKKLLELEQELGDLIIARLYNRMADLKSRADELKVLSENEYREIQAFVEFLGQYRDSVWIEIEDEAHAGAGAGAKAETGDRDEPGAKGESENGSGTGSKVEAKAANNAETQAGAGTGAKAATNAGAEAESGTNAGTNADAEGAGLELQPGGGFVGAGYGVAGKNEAGENEAGENEGSLLDSLKSSLNALYQKVYNTSINSMNASEEMSKLAGSMDIEGLQDDMRALEILDRVMRLTREKYALQAESVIFLDVDGNAYGGLAEKLAGDIQLLQAAVTTDQKKNVEEINSVNNLIDRSHDAFVAEIIAVKDAGLLKSYESLREILRQCMDSAQKLEKSFDSYLAEDINTSERIKGDLIKALAGIAVLSLIIGLATALFLARSISNPIKSLIDVLKTAANGNLSVRAGLRRKDEIGELAEKINIMLEEQQKAFEKVMVAFKDISGPENDLTAAILRWKENIDRISSALKRTTADMRKNRSHGGAETCISGIGQLAAAASSMEEVIVAAVNDGQKAIELAANGEKSIEEAENVIKNITETVQQISSSIKELDESSGRIGNITNTITELASRTNLLALNAAIESARAGQQGKGFAVLAEEIRKLSERSNSAAVDIKELITEIQTKVCLAVANINAGVQCVEDGIRKVRETRDNIGKTMDCMGGVVECVKNISKIADVQAECAAKLMKAVGAIEKDTGETIIPRENIDLVIKQQRDIITEAEQLSEKLKQASKALEKTIEKVKF